MPQWIILEELYILPFWLHLPILIAYNYEYNWFIGNRHMEDAKHVLNNFFPTIQGYLGAKTKADSSLWIHKTLTTDIKHDAAVHFSSIVENIAAVCTIICVPDTRKLQLALDYRQVAIFSNIYCWSSPHRIILGNVGTKVLPHNLRGWFPLKSTL